MRETSLCCRRCFALCVVTGALLSSGCAGNGEGLDENGRPIDDGGGGNSQFTQIQDTIFTPTCTGCHAGASAPRGLRLDSGNSYALLVNVASAEVPSILRVAPGNPDASYLVQKVQGTAAVGARMPLGGPPLPQASIDLIRQWISAGAPAPAEADEDAQATLRVVSTIPGAAESIEPANITNQIVVVFNRTIDASLASAGVFELLGSGGDGSFSEGNEAAIQIASVEVPSFNSQIAILRLSAPLPPEAYQLIIRGSGPVALADLGLHTLDGDEDGAAGGDHQVVFEVSGVTR